MFFRPLCLAIVLCACGNAGNSDAGSGGRSSDASTYATSDVYLPPTTRSGDLLLETPNFFLLRGANWYCSFLGNTGRTPRWVRTLNAAQFYGGRAVVLAYAPEGVTGEPNSSHLCSTAELRLLRFVGSGEETPYLAPQLPANYAIEVPPNAQWVVLSLYNHPETFTRSVRDAIVLRDTPAPQHTVGAWRFDDIGARVEGRTNLLEHELNCDFPGTSATTVYSLRGLTGANALRIRITLEPDGGVPSVLYDNPGGPAFYRDPTVRVFGTDGGVQIRPTDRVRVRCSWSNASRDAVTWPLETCGALFYLDPAGVGPACTTAQTITRGDAAVSLDASADATVQFAGCPTPPTDFEPCIRPCDQGNDQGVGRYCTAGGGECSRNRTAIFCTADFNTAGPGFCVKPCANDDQCGSSARCVSAGGLRGCVPGQCLRDAGLTGYVDATAPPPG